MSEAHALPRIAEASRGAPWLAVAVAVGALGWIVARTAQAFLHPVFSIDSFGTMGAPYSDALGPWLLGGLSILVDGSAPPHVVRPTVGVFWSTLLAATGRIESVPLFFMAAGLASLGGALAARDMPLRRAYALLAVVIAAAFDRTWAPLSFTTTNVDFAAFVFTFTGTLLLLQDDWNAAPKSEVLLASALMLGIAAAIRGPMLVGGAVMLLARWSAARSDRAWRWLIAMLAFAAPLVIDGALRQHFGIKSNASGFLFCVYWDPTHSPTSDCAAAYVSAARTEIEIMEHYASFVFSMAGATFLANAFAARFARDLTVLTGMPVIALALATLLIPFARRDDAQSQPRTIIIRVIGVLGTSWAIAWLLMHHGAPVGVLLFIALFAFALHSRALRGFSCLAAYACATALLCLLGVPFDRYASTFAFLLYLGIALCAVDSARDSAHLHAPPTWPAWTAVALVAFLYLGSFILPSSLRDTYRDSVAGRSAAMKVADDAAIDRSLYLTGARELVYTHHDGNRIGDVRRFTSLAFPGVIENASYREPNAFVE